MTRTLTASMRRMNRLMRPGKATRSLHKTITGLAVDTALAPLKAIAPKKTKKIGTKKATSRKSTATKVGRNLGAVVTQLRAARSLMPGTGTTRRDVAPRVPEGAQYLDRRHRSTSGSCNFKLYLPASAPGRPKGLILMLHGCDQSPDDFAVGTHMNTLAEKHGLAVAYPAQTRRGNSASCWNWFRPENQDRGAGEPAMLAALTRKLMRDFGLGRDAVFVAGLSAGGSMAAILADVYPDVFSAAGLHSALARGSAHDVMSAMSVMRKGAAATGAPQPVIAPDLVRRIVFQGDGDSTVHPSNAAIIVAVAVGSNAQPTRVTSRSVRGRGYTRSDYANADGAPVVELWMLTGAGHAWSGGRAGGTFTDRSGPDASAQMVRFFLSHHL